MNSLFSLFYRVDCDRDKSKSTEHLSEVSSCFHAPAVGEKGDKISNTCLNTEDLFTEKVVN